MGLLKRALRETFGDFSIVWRAPLLGFATATGVGAAFAFGYAFALQDHVAEGGDEYPEVDLDYLWYGLKFSIALLILSVPAYVMVGSMAVPTLLDLGQAGLEGLDVGAVWADAAGQLIVFVVLMVVWALVLVVAMPALMTSFVERGGRLWAAIDPIGAWRTVSRDPAAQGAAMGLAGIWLGLTVVIYGPVSMLSPLDSVVPFFVGTLVIMPLAMAFLLALQRLIGLARRARAERDGVGRHGWEHLETQGPDEHQAGPTESAESPQATADELA